MALVGQRTGFRIVTRKLWSQALALTLTILPWTAQAGGVVVEGVRMPAWVERDAARIPVAPGMAMQPGDRVVTGANARVLLRLPEGSTVKLGEDARFALSSIVTEQKEQRTLMKAGLNVLAGAFRFTTAAVDRLRGGREVDIRFATATVGIRGTDVWGKNEAEREVVCLIEGQVEINRTGETPVVLKDPLTFYIAPAGQPAQPVAPVDPEQLQRWAAETEIAEGQGGASATGAWKAASSALRNERLALDLYVMLRELGYPAALHPQGTAGQRSYVVRIDGFATRADAQVVVDEMAAILQGLTTARFSVTR